MQIPENIALHFIPPYSPELNLAEKIWWKMKRAFSGKLHKTLDYASEFIKRQVSILTHRQVKSICLFAYIANCKYWIITYKVTVLVQIYFISSPLNPFHTLDIYQACRL